ncbi:MAG: hypothetical protein P9E24_15540 [Candidatus Competibacter sp.]|nr:hypothetical protein [Candidatus Competibacter sp.]MDG4583128.1 hypothetical protein [Candidatus Competibacter sp.]
MEQIISELLSAALDTFEAILPCGQGERIVAEDECGDPIYENVGPAPRFPALARRHATRLAQGKQPWLLLHCRLACLIYSNPRKSLVKD